MIAFLWVAFVLCMAALTALLIIDTRRMKAKSEHSLKSAEESIRSMSATHAAYRAAREMIRSGKKVKSIGPGFVVVNDDDGSTHKVWMH